MNVFNTFLEVCRNTVRNRMAHIAYALDRLSGGKLSPNMVTIAGLLAHLPIAWLIAQANYELAAVLLVIFGLFDTLDGALARLQNRVTRTGMLLDSVTDRVKEVILYAAVANTMVTAGQPYMAVWAVAACGASLLVSYVNAWGEAVLGASVPKTHKLNRAFRTGLMSFEIRMVFLIVGLLAGRIIEATVLIAMLSALTALTRFINVSREI